MIRSGAGVIPLTMSCDARAIANLLLREAQAQQITLTNLKLQKLLFLCHAFYLVQTGKALVKGNFVAWQYGPVHREAYDAFKRFAAKPITEEADKLDPVTGMRKSIPAPDDRTILEVVQKIVQFYGPKSAGELVELTHAKGGPWDFVVQQAKSNANLGMTIADDVIVKRFRFLWFGSKPNLKDQDLNEDQPLVA